LLEIVSNNRICDSTDNIPDNLSYCIQYSTIYTFESENPSCYLQKKRYDYSITHGIVDTINLFKVDGVNFVKLDLMSDTLEITDDILPKLVFILVCHYDKNTMVQKNGIIKDKKSNYYYIYSDNENNNRKISITSSSCSGNVGGLAKINSKVVLCVTEEKYSSITTENISYYYMSGDQLATESSLTVGKTSFNGVITFGINYFIEGHVDGIIN